MAGWMRWSRALVVGTALVLGITSALPAQAQSAPAGSSQNPQVSRVAGTIKSIQGGTITLTSDAGQEVKAQLAGSTRILRVEPGQKDLSQAATVSASDLQPGDRVLVRGQASADGKAIAALAVIVMKQSDVTAKREHDRQDWQRRGVGGIVDTVDAASGTVTITSGGFGTAKKIAIHTTKDTILRRYAPDSVKFDEAKPAPLDQIKAGDQLRARGTRSEDGSELTADEIVSGTFRNIAGTIITVDNAGSSMTVKDAISKSTVTVKITPDSQMKKLPAEMAQRIGMRLKAGNGQGVRQQAPAETAQRPEGATDPGAKVQGSPGARGNGSPDFERLLARLPNSTVADLQKGDAVMIVSTSGEGATPVTAITLLAGVEPILTAAPNRSAVLSPWTLGGGAAEGESGP